MKVVKLVPTVEHVWNGVMAKIENHNILAPNIEQVLKKWEIPQNAHPFPLKPKPHAGQILGRKELPNGNIKTRIVSAMEDYEGRPVVIVEGKIVKPSGELLEAYYGVRTVKSNGTQEFMVDTDPNKIKEAVNKLFNSNPDAKRLF